MTASAANRAVTIVAEALHAEGECNLCNHLTTEVPRTLEGCPNRVGWSYLAADLLADIRPLIEAEVRERVAREIETAHDGYAHDPQASDLRAGLFLALCIVRGDAQ